jgi:hypothetical protein
MLLHDTKVDVWCAAISATRIIRPTLFSDTVNSKRYVGQILAPCFENLSDEEKECGVFQQYSPVPHTANNSVAALHHISGGQIMNPMWPAPLPDLMPCDYYVWKSFMKTVHTNRFKEITTCKDWWGEQLHNTCTLLGRGCDN